MSEGEVQQVPDHASDVIDQSSYSPNYEVEDDSRVALPVDEESCEIIDDNGQDEQYDIGLEESDSGFKPKNRHNAPGKVVHIALIPPITRDEDLSFICLAFGEIKMLLYIRKKRHAMVCFERQEDAESMVKYFARFPGELFGSRLSIEFSDHEDLDFPSMSRGVLHTQAIVKQSRELKRIAEEGSPGSVLRVVVKSPSTIPLTMDILYKIFSEFGVVMKIVISKKSNCQEAFVQMRTAANASAAIETFASSPRYAGCGGLGKLEVNTAREHSLNIKYNNARSRDFTNPTLFSSPDVDAQSFIALSANANIAECRDVDMYLVRRLVGAPRDGSPASFSRFDRGPQRRRPYSGGDDRRSPIRDSMDDIMLPKRRRPDYPHFSDQQPFDPWQQQGRSSLLEEFGLSSNVGRQPNSSPTEDLLNSLNKDDLIDQLLLLTARNPQPSSAALAESLASGRLDGNTIAAAKQILTERAMSAIAQDPYTRLLNTLISSNGGNPGNFLMGRRGFSPDRRDSSRMDRRHSGVFNSFTDEGVMHGSGMCDETNEAGRVLLVSNLNAEKINPDALFTLFGVYGDVQRVKVMFTKSGSALVQMTNADQALQAIHYLHGIVIYNKRMRIIVSKYSNVQVAREGLEGEQWSRNYEDSPLHRYSRPGSRNCMNIYPPSEQLHLSNISDDTERDELQEIFEKYGLVRNIRFFFTDRRMGVVEMETVSAACEALIGAHNIMLRCNRRLRISFAKPKH